MSTMVEHNKKRKKRPGKRKHCRTGEREKCLLERCEATSPMCVGFNVKRPNCQNAELQESERAQSSNVCRRGEKRDTETPLFLPAFKKNNRCELFNRRGEFHIRVLRLIISFCFIAANAHRCDRLCKSHDRRSDVHAVLFLTV